jgi:hypothetical protein
MPEEQKDITSETAPELVEEINTYDPTQNPNVISLIKQDDGNYIGYMNKGGKVVTARQADPHTVLELLITHDGTQTD